MRISDWSSDVCSSDLIGANYIQQIAAEEIGRFLRREGTAPPDAVDLKLRVAFNQTLESTWFTGSMALLQVINMLAILLTGAALMREREHGTLEHLLVKIGRASCRERVCQDV